MFLMWWVGARFVPGGSSCFSAMINSLVCRHQMTADAESAQVHVFMYFYYFLAAMGPAYKKWTWWKVYMTKMQLVRARHTCTYCHIQPTIDGMQAQFYIVLVHSALAIYATHTQTCAFPEWMTWGWLVYCLSLIALFSHFYTRAYVKGERAPATRDPKHH